MWSIRGSIHFDILFVIVVCSIVDYKAPMQQLMVAGVKVLIFPLYPQQMFLWRKTYISDDIVDWKCLYEIL